MGPILYATIQWLVILLAEYIQMCVMIRNLNVYNVHAPPIGKKLCKNGVMMFFFFFKKIKNVEYTCLTMSQFLHSFFIF